MSWAKLIPGVTLTCLAVSLCFVPRALAAQGEVIVCITTGKEAPITGERDIHVWIRNNAAQSLAGLRLTFFVEDKGITHHAIPRLEPGVIHKVTRNHGWATAGKRRLVADVEGGGTQAVRVEGRIGIHVVKPAYQSEKIVACSNGRQLSEAEIPVGTAATSLGPPPMDLKLSVCVSTGKNPPVGGGRDIHAWVVNRGQAPVSGLTLYFAVEDKAIETYPLPLLGPGQKARKTRHHAWSSSGQKKIRAMALWPDKVGKTIADGVFKVSPLGAPTQSDPQNVNCADGTLTTEAGM